ncbi:helix-turn-helix domain-containing protein [Streptomyces clavuligerus]|uniref:helix-turn-helix domain-containing protein n=1 Tax=Streptomyces clavuligerus TaxID=1901 RepID=UPI00017FF631|nr:helix-turn-helix transcriptional regulator [Streptomyces clavuligerus]EDY49228.1 DNA-binding protein [Streptomyces clavuligerus]WDN56140.1 helix-turn-helix transcriptional regulator [Streptomyces clavuligerus]
MSRKRSGRTMAHLVLATRLKALRQLAGISLDQAAAALGAHTVTVRRIELAKTSLDVGQVDTLLNAYGVPPAEIEEFLGKLASANRPGWWHPWTAVMDPWQLDLMGVESAASIIRLWDPVLIPELLRTPCYAREVESVLRPDLAPSVRRGRTELLLERQSRLREQRTQIWAVIPAAALHTQVGDKSVMEEQLNALRRESDRPEVTLQLHPLHAPLHALRTMSALTLFRVGVPGIPDHAVLENGLAGTAEVRTDPERVSAYRQLLDHSCALALQPAHSKEAFQ